MNKYGINIILLAVVFLAAGLYADDYGTDSPFSFGIGARDLSLSGSAFVNCQPAAAVFWNPSALARAQRLSFALFHSRLYDADVAYQYFGLAFPTVDYGSFALGVFRLGVDGIEKRDNSNFLLGEFDDSRLAFYLAYARNVSGYDAGLALTLERHSLDNYSATSSPGLNLSLSRGFELGLSWLPEMTAGIHGRNLIRPGIKLRDETVNYPYSLDGGISLKIIPSRKWNQHLSISAAIRKIDHFDPCPAFGLEYDLYGLISLRGSLRDSKVSFGMGLTYKLISFDYALVERDLGSLHMFSVTTDIGRTRSEKLRMREEKREARFNELMNSNLKKRNTQMVADLFARAEEAVEDNNYDEAIMLFDRGIFIAASNGLDTGAIYSEALETRILLEEILARQNFENLMDSVRVKRAQGNLFEARYFANLALEKTPESMQVETLLSEINLEIERTTTKDKLIESRLALADSLLNYDHVDKALAALQSIEQYSGDDARIGAAIRKARFERWRQTAQEVFTKKDYSAASIALDSAQTLFPEHPWCSELRQKIRHQIRLAAADKTVPVSQPVQPELSQEDLKEVREAYAEGRKFFEAGQLMQAITHWEKVENLSPDYMSVREYLVNAYKYVGVELYGCNQLPEAVEVWKKAAALEPANAEIENYIKRTENEIIRLQELTYGTE
jgi:tetratricopeptide (TPR) repeat protein